MQWSEPEMVGHWEGTNKKLKNWCFWIVVLEKIIESPLDCKEIQPVNPKGNQSEYSSEGLMLKLKLQYLATWCKELSHLQRPWCWERLKAVGEGDNREWDGWIASLIQWIWVWVNSGSWWWTGRPGVLQSMGLQKVGQDWATELNRICPPLVAPLLSPFQSTELIISSSSPQVFQLLCYFYFTVLS